MYIVNRSLFLHAMKNKGYRSVQALARKLEIHRNTINYYLGGREVVSKTLERILDDLGLTPESAFIRERDKSTLLQEAIANLIDELHKKFPELSFVLFGSHVHGRAHKYSDFDIGVFKIGGMSYELFRNVILIKEELEENLPFLVDLVNLNYADTDFLKKISKNWIFLTGKQGDWVEFNRKISKSGN